MTANRTLTRGRRTRRVIDLATDDINLVGRGVSPEERSQAIRRALVLRWARQRRYRNLGETAIR